MTKLQRIIISNLKNCRKKMGISQAKLAEQCGLSTSYIAEIEMGRSTPSIKSLENIARVLNIEPYQLLLDRADIPSKNDLLDKIERDFSEKSIAFIKNILDFYRDET